MKNEIIRININVPSKLLKDFDEIVEKKFTNRTELIKLLMIETIQTEFSPRAKL